MLLFSSSLHRSIVVTLGRNANAAAAGVFTPTRAISSSSASSDICYSIVVVVGDQPAKRFGGLLAHLEYRYRYVYVQ